MSVQRKLDEAKSNNGPRILVVDDDQTILDILTVILEDGGYQVTTANSAEEGLVIYKEYPFPLIFTDLRMSCMDGMELLRKIKETKEDSQIIIMTAHASLDTSVESIREGAYDYLIKPLSDHSVVLPLAKRALEKVRLIVENDYLIKKLENSNVELKQANHLLREITLKDSLTGLYNKRYLKEVVDSEFNRSRRHKRDFSILFCDIDHFKNFNDTNGHLLGDNALERFATIVSQRLRVTDLASRYGGEEFVLLLPETSKEDATILAIEICEMVYAAEFEGEKNQPNGKLTVSIGVSTFPQDGDNWSDIISHADKALYKAKSSGRNRVYVEE